MFIVSNKYSCWIREFYSKLSTKIRQKYWFISGVFCSNFNQKLLMYLSRLFPHWTRSFHLEISSCQGDIVWKFFTNFSREIFLRYAIFSGFQCHMKDLFTEQTLSKRDGWSLLNKYCKTHIQNPAKYLRWNSFENS